MKNLYVIEGTSNSGKSTTSQFISDYSNVLIVPEFSTFPEAPSPSKNLDEEKLNQRIFFEIEKKRIEYAKKMTDEGNIVFLERNFMSVLAVLDENHIQDVINTSKEERLKQADLIVSSPYTRALQTAAIISKETGLDIKIDHDLREWEPDSTYMYKATDTKSIYKDYMNNNGIYPNDREVNWESKDSLNKRVLSVIEKYKDEHECVIFVFHQMAIQAVTDKEKIAPAEIVEYLV